MVTFPSIFGSIVYLTPRMSPRIVFAAWAGGTLTRFSVTPSSLWSLPTCCGADRGSPTKRPVPSTTVGSPLGISGCTDVPGVLLAAPGFASSRGSGTGRHELTTDESSIVWQADVDSARTAIRKRQHVIVNFSTRNDTTYPPQPSRLNCRHRATLQ